MRLRLPVGLAYSQARPRRTTQAAREGHHQHRRHPHPTKGATVKDLIDDALTIATVFIILAVLVTGGLLLWAVR